MTRFAHPQRSLPVSRDEETLVESLAWDIGATYKALERDHIATRPGGLVVATVRWYEFSDIEIPQHESPPDFSNQA